MHSGNNQAGSATLIVLTALAAGALGLASAWWMAQPDHRIDPFTRLAGEIGCQCGDCNLRPIGTCGCGFADGMLAELRELVDTGQSDEQVMTTLVARYNSTIRIKPDSSGFGLLAWAVPILLLTMGAVGVGAVLSHWARKDFDDDDPSKPPVASPSTPATTMQDDNDARLRAIVERELDSLSD